MTNADVLIIISIETEVTPPGSMNIMNGLIKGRDLPSFADDEQQHQKKVKV
jgi:hypothetical protein